MEFKITGKLLSIIMHFSSLSILFLIGSYAGNGFRMIHYSIGLIIYSDFVITITLLPI